MKRLSLSFRASVIPFVLIALWSATFAPSAVSAGSVTLSPSSAAFDTLDLGHASAARVITLANGTVAAISISGITISGDFQIVASTCGASLAASKSCTISVTFTPAAIGTRTGTLSVSLPGIGNLATALSGSGAAISVAPRPLNFGNVTVGTVSFADVVLTNLGSSAVTFTGIFISGPNRPDFAISTNTCAHSLAAQQSCKVNIRFAPGLLGKETAVLIVRDNSGGSIQNYLYATGADPLPDLTSIFPSSVFGGGQQDFLLSLNGTNFTPFSVVRWNGIAVPTVFNFGGMLTAHVPASYLATAGPAQISVFNPPPAGGTSVSFTFTVLSNLLPALASLSPSGVIFGTGPVTITVNGSNFEPTTMGFWNGSNRPTMYVSSTQLMISITAADTAAVGANQVTVSNRVPGGGLSNPLPFAVQGNPVPSLNSMSPSQAVFGTGGFTLTISGANFQPSSVLQWNGANRPTTVLSATQIQAAIPANDVASLGTANVQLITPAPGGGTSNTLVFTITGNPVPLVSSTSPSVLVPGSSGFTLVVYGGGFVSSSVVQWNGSNRATTFVNNFQLTASIPASDIAVGGTAQVTAFNPAPGGGTSSSVLFYIGTPNPVPVLASISPTIAVVNSSGVTVTAFGSNFLRSSVVQWDGSPRPTTFVSSTELQGQISASDLSSAASRYVFITVFTPAPAGGTSYGFLFSVFAANPVPLLHSISPMFATVGGSGVAITVDGGNVLASSVVQWNGSARPTTFINNSQLVAQISAADLATPGPVTVSVFTPPPGGGTSPTAAFTVTLPANFTALNISANDLLWDPYRRLIYCSVPASAASNANTVTVVDPFSGTVLSSVSVGSNPDKLAMSDDGQYLYVGLDGPGSVQRLLLPSLSPDINVTLGAQPPNGSYFALNLDVIPGSPHSFAVVLGLPNLSPSAMGVAVFDDNVERPHVADPGGFPAIIGSIQFGNSASTLYGYDNEGGGEFVQLSVDATGVSVSTQTSNLIAPSLGQIHFDGGLIYVDNGQVIDPQKLTPVGAYPVPAGVASGVQNGAIAPDSSLGRSFFVTLDMQNNLALISAFDQSQFTSLGTVITGLPLYSNFARRLIRWGSSGLAFQVRNGYPDQVVLLTSPLVLPPSATNNPVPAASALSPATARTGSGNFQLTVTGSNFVLGASVQWNGHDRTTKFVSSTQLIAYIPASDIAAAGTPQVTVVNPAPAGGASNALTLTVAP